MIVTVGPRIIPQTSGAPQFAVQFSRPRTVSERSNSFRWTGPGTVHILEHGLLVMTRRRSPLGFRTADERFVPAADIGAVSCDGDAVRVDLSVAGKPAGFFRFWTGHAALASTIVRLLPTAHTIDFEGTVLKQISAARPPLTLWRQRGHRRRLLSVALIVGLVAVLLAADIVVHWRAHAGHHPGAAAAHKS